MTLPVPPADRADAAKLKQSAPADALDFTPVPLRQTCHGWTAERQRVFILALAETGSVTLAAQTAGVTARSAYRLRLRPGAQDFHRAWMHAQRVAVEMLTSVAFDRAIHGTPRKIYHKGEAVAEEWQPSDRLLMWLLRHLDPTRFGNLSGLQPYKVSDPVATARRALPRALDRVADLPPTPEPDMRARRRRLA